MAISFPNSPTTGTTVTVGSVVYTYDGTAWRTAGTSFNGGTITGTLFVNNITAATSTSTGALQVAGGVGVGGNIVFGGEMTGRVKGYSLTTNARGNVSGNQTIDLSLGNYVTATTTGATTWTFTATVASPNAIGFVLELTNGGSAVQTWPTTTRWPAGTAPTLTVTGTDVLTFISDDGGSNWRGVASMLDSK